MGIVFQYSYALKKPIGSIPAFLKVVGMKNQNSNIACRIFAEQIRMLQSLPNQDDAKNILYQAVIHSLNQFENQNDNQIENQNDNQIENQNENAYVSVSVSVSDSPLSKSIFNLLAKSIVWKEFSNNYGGKRINSGRKSTNEEFTRQCAAKSRGVSNRWGKTSITTLKDENNTSTTGVIVSERERIGIEERIKEQKQKNQVENHLENQVENQVANQDANQDMFQVVDKDKDNINIIINKLKNILVNYHKRDFSTRNWRDSVDKMLRIDKIPFDDVIKCLDWYTKHIGEDFVPVIASGSSLREKYVKLENAVKRDLPKDNIQNFVPDAKREQESRLARMAELAKIENMKRVQQKYGV